MWMTECLHYFSRATSLMARIDILTLVMETLAISLILNFYIYFFFSRPLRLDFIPSGLMFVQVIPFLSLSNFFYRRFFLFSVCFSLSLSLSLSFSFLFFDSFDMRFFS